MVCLTFYIKRSVRLCLDFFVKLIGVIYPSKTNYLPPINDRLLVEPLVVLVKRIQSGELKSEQLVKAYIDRIKTVQPQINAVIDECFSQSVLDAIEVDKRVKHELDGNQPLNGVSIYSQPLLGIPFSGKDSVAIKDMLFCAGCPARKHIRATEDSPLVKYLRDAGAIPVCMTNVPELLMWWNAHNKTFGQTYNPYDKSIIPGGSGGGNASLVGAAASILAISGDIGGSTRIPAFFCGVFGHCTTPQLVPTDSHWPPYPEGRLKLLSYGPTVRYASDLKTALKVFLGPNVSKLSLDQSVDLTQLKVYYMYDINDPLLSPLSSETKKGIDNCVQHLQSLGATAQQINLEKFDHSFLIWQSFMKVEGVTPLAQELTNRKGAISPFLELIKSVYGGSEHTIEAIFAAIFDANPPNDDVLQNARKIGEQLKEELHHILGNDGILLCATHPDSCVKLNATLFNFKNVCYTAVFNSLYVSVTQVPIGLNTKGLPLGVQVIAKPYNDHLTIAVAEEFERKFGGWVPPTTIVAN